MSRSGLEFSKDEKHHGSTSSKIVGIESDDNAITAPLEDIEIVGSLAHKLVSLVLYSGPREHIDQHHEQQTRDIIACIDKNVGSLDGYVASTADLPYLTELLSDVRRWQDDLALDQTASQLFSRSNGTTRNPHEYRLTLQCLEGHIIRLLSKKDTIDPRVPTAAARPELLARPDLLKDTDNPIAWPSSELAGIDLINVWISNCDVYHKEHCNIGHVPTPVLRPIDHFILRYRPRYLIDVQRYCLVSANRDMRYVALSYVWGKAPSSRTLKRNLDFSMQPGSLRRLPQTIADAITLVSSIGESYLWVDALCIVQDDEKSKSIEFELMGPYYANAYLTIVAANGTAESGLNVAPRPLRGKPRFERQVLQQHCTALKQSAWNNRGWTFQEQIFSPRLLIYGEFGVSWECHCYIGAEGIQPRHEMCRNAPKTVARGFDFGRLPSIHDMSRHVVAYSRRDFTYPEDILEAFTGILNTLGDTYPGGFFAGLPAYLFDESLLWVNKEPLRKRCARRPGTNQRVAPSWSWAAWHGEICGTKDRYIQATRRLIYWDFQDESDDERRSSSMPVGSIKLLSPENQAQHKSKEPIPAYNIWQVPRPTAAYANSVLTCRVARCVMPVENCEKFTVTLNVRTNPDDVRVPKPGITLRSGVITSCEAILPGQEPRECELVAISRNERYYNVLWIEWVDGIAYRKGIGQISSMTWKRQDTEVIDLMLG